FIFEHNQAPGTLARVQLRIYTLAGRPVRTIELEEPLSGGLVQIPFDGLDEDFDRLPSGVYLHRVRVAVDQPHGRTAVTEHIERLPGIRWSRPLCHCTPPSIPRYSMNLRRFRPAALAAPASAALLVAGVLLAGAARPASAQIVQTTAVPFLQIEPDSRAAGMGMTGVAVADNASALFWN